MIVYGLTTCDTTRKALAALKAAGHAPVFRDVRQAPLSPAEIARLEVAFGDRLVNRASATWRALDEATRGLPVQALIAAQPTVMKRPVIEAGSALHLGWTPEVARALTGAGRA